MSSFTLGHWALSETIRKLPPRSICSFPLGHWSPRGGPPIKIASTSDSRGFEAKIKLLRKTYPPVGGGKAA